MTTRELATKIAWLHYGTFYSWGGDDPSGFDCSGFIVEILKSVGLLPRKSDLTAAGLHDRFVEVSNPEEGALVFFKSITGKIVHVEYCLDDYYMIGASGGGSRTKTKEDAIRDNAFIKVRPIASDNRPKLYANPLHVNV